MISFTIFLLVLFFIGDFPLLSFGLIQKHPEEKEDGNWPLDSKLMTSEVEFMQKLLNRRLSSDTGHVHGGSSATGYAPRVGPPKGKNCGKREGNEGFTLEFRLNELKPGERPIRAELHLHTPGHLYGRISPGFGNLWPAKQDKLIGKTMRIVPKNIELFVNWDCNGWERTMVEKREEEEEVQMPGWAVYDATQLLSEARNRGINELNIQLKRRGKTLSKHQLKRLVHLHRPFIVVYTDFDEMPNDLEKTGNEYGKRSKREIRATVTHYGGEEEIRKHMEEARKTAEYYAYGMARAGPTAGKALGTTDSALGGRNAGSWPLLNRRRQKGKKGRRLRNPKFNANDPMLGFGTAHSPWDRSLRRRQLMQSPNAGNSIGDILALQEHSYSVEQRQRELENAEDTKVVLLNKEQQQKAKDKCTRQNMTVDFHRLGWTDRIIAPKQFDAGACVGSCQYPLEQDVSPSNHAILQSLLLHNKKMVENPIDLSAPPPVCCAPEKYDSLTLLYFDERDNVVLKNYPKMVVLQCGCI